MGNRGRAVWRDSSAPGAVELALDPRPHGPVVVTVGAGAATTARSAVTAALLDAVTTRPNSVIVDLSRTPGTDELAPGLAAVLRTLDAWPHAPILVVADEWTRLALTARTSPGSVEVVETVAAARAAVTTRPWVSSALTRLHPPLTSRALARGLVLEFAQARGLRHRLDAAMLAADELIGHALHGTGHGVELRLAARDGAIGVAVAELIDPSPTDPSPGGTPAGRQPTGRRGRDHDVPPSGGMDLVQTLADSCGSATRPDGGTLVWSVFTWGRVGVSGAGVRA